MLKNTLAAIAVGAMMTALPTVADASVTYTLAGQSYTYADPNIPASSRAPFLLSFTLADGALDDGAFRVDGRGGSGPSAFTGDVADFLGAVIDGEVVDAGKLRGTFLLSLAGDAVALELRGEFKDVSLSGSLSSFGGTFAGDGRPGCSGAFPCTVNGRLVSDVPEPVSLALLGTGLLGLVAVRRRV